MIFYSSSIHVISSICKNRKIDRNDSNTESSVFEINTDKFVRSQKSKGPKKAKVNNISLDISSSSINDLSDVQSMPSASIFNPSSIPISSTIPNDFGSKSIAVNLKKRRKIKKQNLKKG